MIDKIIFRNGTAYFVKDKHFVYEPYKEFPVDSLIQFMNCVVELDENTTFEHVWNYLERDVEFFNTLFFRALGGFDLNEYVEQFHKPSKDPNDYEDPNHRMVGLSLGWDGDVWEGKLNIFTDFGGYGPHKMPNGEFIEDMGYGVELTPINDLKHYPLKLEKKFVIRSEENGYKELLVAEKEWSVYDMYYGILFEISFIGTPNDQLRSIADLDQRQAEVVDYLKKHPLPKKENEK